MAPGFTLVKQFSTILQLAASLCLTPEICCNRLATALSAERLFTSSNSNYVLENRKYWSATAVSSPSCILVPESSSVVSTAVKLLVENNCEFGVRGGGHTTIPGWAGTDSGVLISLSKLKDIEISEDKTSVVIGAGNRWGEVYAKIGEHGITVAGGRISSVGVSGFILGGGLSFLMHSEGFGANNVLSYEIVLANGEIATVTEESTGDLFKALKGGTGNFGIVTSFKLRAFPVNKAYAGSLYYAPDQYDALFPIMESYARNGVESDPKTHVISFFICVPSQEIEMGTFYSFYSDPVTAPPAAIKPFFDVPTLVNTVKMKTVKEAADELGTGIEDGMRQDMRTFSIRANAELYKELFDIWNSTANDMIRASDKKGGNVLGLEPAPDPLIIVSYLFSWNLAEDDEKVYPAIEKLIAASMDIAKSQGRFERFIYLNYASTDQQPIHAYGPTQVDFLRKVKAKYDPHGVFDKLSRGGFKIPS